MRNARLVTVFAATAAIGIGPSGLAACSSSQPAASTASTPVSGGTLTYALDVEPSCLDPHVSPADATAVIQRAVFDSLVYQDAQGAFHPWLASSWTVSPDGRTYTFQLRHDVKFTDGTALDASVVKANFDHINAVATKSQYASALFGSAYQGTKATGTYAVEVDFSRGFAPFLQAASTTYLGIASAQSLKQYANQLCAGGGHSVGSGPFKEVSYTRGQGIQFVRNPAYAWAPAGYGHTGPAYLDKFAIRFLPDDSVRTGALTSGQVDAAVLPVTSVKTVQADSALSYVQHQSPGVVYSLQLNQSRGPLADERVRQAVLDAADISSLIKSVYFGFYQRAWSPLSPATPGAYDAALANSWGYDPAKAAALLDQAGYTGRDSAGYRTKNGVRLTLDWIYTAQSQRDQRNVLGEALVAQFKSVGVELKRDPVDIGTYFTRIGKDDYDVLDLSWARGDADILRGFFHSSSTSVQGSENASKTDDPQVDAWLDQAAASTSQAQRDADYRAVQEWTIQHAVVLPLYASVYQIGISTKVHGVTYGISGGPEFYGSWVGR